MANAIPSKILDSGRKVKLDTIEHNIVTKQIHPHQQGGLPSEFVWEGSDKDGGYSQGEIQGQCKNLLLLLCNSKFAAYWQCNNWRKEQFHWIFKVYETGAYQSQVLTFPWFELLLKQCSFFWHVNKLIVLSNSKVIYNAKYYVITLT